MEWLTQLLERLFCWLPRIWLVSPDESGVRITLGKHYRATPPGWYVYWPLIQSCTRIVVTPQVVDLRCQSIVTHDGRDMCVSGAIKYRIKDAVAALLKVQDYDTTLQIMALGLISRYISQRAYEDCKNLNDIEESVKKAVRDEARGWGLDIMTVYITDLGITRNLRLLTNGSLIQTISSETKE